MCLKAVRIDETDDEALRILNAILPDRRTWIEVSPTKIAVELGLSEAVVRYNIKKLVKLGYIRPVNSQHLKNCYYEPTLKVLFLNKK